ncbi:MAG: TldD/PmbA family protein [Planctomycetota bacterium]|nr:TldD/PmbA family protein [Planctomycetota bacterium]
MALLQQDHALDLCRELVEKSPADQTEVTLECVEDRFVRYADEGPTQTADRERYDLAIRVRLNPSDAKGPFAGWREARATCGTLDPEDAQAALERAMTLAEVTEPNPDLVPMGGPVAVAETAAERPTMDHTFREKAAWVDQARSACEENGLVPAGLTQTTAATRSVVNSQGRAVHGARTRAAFSLTASPANGEGGSGFAEVIHKNVERLDVTGAIGRAVDKAVRSRHTEPVDAGTYTVVLEPAAVASLLLFAGYHGFGAREVHEQSSFLCGRVGERIFPESLLVADHAANEVYPGFLFDGEGSPRARVVLLEDGALLGPVTDERWARKLGLPNTGHGRSQPSPHGPSTTNLYLAPGSQSIDQLVAGIDRGLLISQFHYTNMIEPKGLTLTGMTRNGTFLIENGRVGTAVKNLRFTQSLVGALQHVTGVGEELEVAGALFDGEVVCPALRIENFQFTSTTDF